MRSSSPREPCGLSSFAVDGWDQIRFLRSSQASNFVGFFLKKKSALIFSSFLILPSSTLRFVAWPEDGEQAAVLQSATGAEPPLCPPRSPLNHPRAEAGGVGELSIILRQRSSNVPVVSCIVYPSPPRAHNPGGEGDNAMALSTPKKDVFCSLLSCRLAA